MSPLVSSSTLSPGESSPQAAHRRARIAVERRFIVKLPLVLQFSDSYRCGGTVEPNPADSKRAIVYHGIWSKLTR
jgi:hypothetical protein